MVLIGQRYTRILGVRVPLDGAFGPAKSRKWTHSGRASNGLTRVQVVYQRFCYRDYERWPQPKAISTLARYTNPAFAAVFGGKGCNLFAIDTNLPLAPSSPLSAPPSLASSPVPPPPFCVPIPLAPPSCSRGLPPARLQSQTPLRSKEHPMSFPHESSSLPPSGLPARRWPARAARMCGRPCRPCLRGRAPRVCRRSPRGPGRPPRVFGLHPRAAQRAVCRGVPRDHRRRPGPHRRDCEPRRRGGLHGQLCRALGSSPGAPWWV